ncbi:hypothetical protein AMS68_004824 [Peltaster fructicola]|uniref:Metallo-beta-lactamase domain-containing protein n=1 Tax=Peltaster fructicola TaxID=286661 RepID=A0A6H0XX10_9PEZI|nr:hypothetical protein AMS68_004824 [Peltaster fructicola]
MADLLELDSLEILAIIDNELDPISPCVNPAIRQFGGLRDIASRSKNSINDIRGSESFELRMSNICCSAHGLSLMITGIKGNMRHTILFDTGPEENSWERNATRLRADVSRIEMIQLSHYHRDHSGGMLKALDMIKKAQQEAKHALQPVVVDLHPDRPAFRGFQPPGHAIVSFEADPTFEDIEKAGGVVQTRDQPHVVLENMFLVSGEIPRGTPYEQGLKFGMRFEDGVWRPDEAMKDERLLMCKLKGMLKTVLQDRYLLLADKGLVVFTGCAHAGVVNSARYAVDLGQGTPLYAVVGGFHLADAQPEVIDDTVRDLEALEPQLLLPGHCTGWRAKFALQSKMPGRIVPCFVGSGYEL